MRRLQRAEVLAERDGISVSEVAMHYFFSSTMNVYAVVSMSSPERLQMNICAAASPLSAADVQFLEAED